MRQHGVLSRNQLLDGGIDRHAVGHRLARGRLHVVHRGVYAVGHPILTQEGRWMAAVLATGGVLSHRAAAALWGIVASPYLEVTARSIRRRPGIRTHRSALRADEVTTERRIPVTSVSRTLFDLAKVVPRRQVERALNEAEVRGLTDRLSLPDLLGRNRGRRGAPVIRTILEGGTVVTRSELEALFLDFVATHGLPRPETNVDVLVRGLWLECDCVWRRQRLMVELDSRKFHGTAAAFERDRARDRRLSAAGWTVFRVTWLQLHRDPEALGADLRAALVSRRT